MPPRVIPAHVTAILQTTIVLAPFITAASLIVDQHLLGQGLSTALLFEIERWLAAHLACVRDPRVMEAKEGNVSTTFQRGKPGDEGLQTTDYGKQVLLLDPTGILAQVFTTTRRASIRVY